MSDLDQIKPYIVSRRGLLIYSIILGFTLALLIIGGIVLISENRDAIHRISHLEHPTAKDVQRGVEQALQECSRDPRCFNALKKFGQRPSASPRHLGKHLAPKIHHAVNGQTSDRIGNPHTDTTVPGRAHTSPPARSPGRSPKQTPSHTGSGTSGPPPTGAGSGGGSGAGAPPMPSSPPPAPPAVGVTTPLPVPSVCSPLVKINC